MSSSRSGWIQSDLTYSRSRPRCALLQPVSGRGHVNLGSALSDKGQFDSATAADQTILHFNPDSLAVENDLMKTTLGSILVRPGNQHGGRGPDPWE